MSTSPVVSYMLVAFRPYYASRTISEIVRKTTVSYELLLWLNVDSPHLEEYVGTLQAAGHPIRIVGKTPENIGMRAFKTLIQEAEGEFLVQCEDDVIHISRRAAEIAGEIFDRYPDVMMLGGHVWQDEFTTGARPPMSLYNPMVHEEGLYEGPIDGGFTFYRRANIPMLLESVGDGSYFGLGVGTHLKWIRQDQGRKGWLSIRIQMFHLNGPLYHSFFPGMLEFEIAKYRKIQYFDVAQAYEDAKSDLPPREDLERNLREAEAFFESFDFSDVPAIQAHLRSLEARIPPPPPHPETSPGVRARIDLPGPRGGWHYVR